MSSESKQDIVQISLQFWSLINDVMEGDFAKLCRRVKYDAIFLCGSVQSYNGKVWQVPSPWGFFFGWVDLANVTLLQILSDVSE